MFNLALILSFCLCVTCYILFVCFAFIFAIKKRKKLIATPWIKNFFWILRIKISGLYFFWKQSLSS